MILNHQKIRYIIQILINPTLYFIKTNQDYNIGINSGSKQVDGTTNKNRVIKIKENHMILMMTLSKRCLEDGHFNLTEEILNVILITNNCCLDFNINVTNQ